jgi:hypothetical protein
VPVPPRWRSAVGVVAALVLAAQTAYADGSADSSAAIERLIAKGSADALATAAVLKQFGAESDNGAHVLVDRAVQAAPDRRDLAWLAVRLCASSSDCDDTAPEKHLREVDPGNGIGWIGALARAQRKNDVATIDSALSAIGQSERFYVYFDPLVAATAGELAAAHSSKERKAVSRSSATGKPSAVAEPLPTVWPSAAHSSRPNSSLPQRQIARATMEMAGVIAASVLPPSQSFSMSCRGLALEQVAGRLERCRRAAQAITRADTFLVEGLGLSLQQRLWPLDSPEGSRITAQRRVLQYRLEEYSHLDISSSKLDEFPADALDVFRTHAREQDAALVYFTRAGVPPDPPANWTSHSPPRVP